MRNVARKKEETRQEDGRSRSKRGKRRRKGREREKIGS